MEPSAKPIKEEGATSLVGAKSSSRQFSTRPAVRTRDVGYPSTVLRKSVQVRHRQSTYVDHIIKSRSCNIAISQPTEHLK